MYACLHALDAALRALGSRLLVVEGDPVVELPRLAATLEAGVLSHARNHEPAARAREARVARALERDGVVGRSAEAGPVQAPRLVTPPRGGTSLVYSAYARAWEALDAPAAVPVPRQWATASALRGVGAGVPEVPAGFELPPAGEDAARKRLDAFLRDRVRRYPETRDLPGLDATSRLSPHLRWGTISGAGGVRPPCATRRCAKGSRCGRGSSPGATSMPSSSSHIPQWRASRCGRSGSAGVVTSGPSGAGRKGSRGCRWSTPACASCARPASCTTARA